MTSLNVTSDTEPLADQSESPKSSSSPAQGSVKPGDFKVDDIHESSPDSSPNNTFTLVQDLANLHLDSLNKCHFCDSTNHKMKMCKQYKKAKAGTSAKPYIAHKGLLRPCDVYGFAAAGVLAVQGDKVLMIREHRPIKVIVNGVEVRPDSKTPLLYKKNFIGGRRNNYSETPLDTAMREFKEEISMAGVKEELKLSVSGAVLWSPQSKYGLFAAALPEDFVLDDNKMLHWVSFRDLACKSYRDRELHDFSSQMIEQISRLYPGLKTSSALKAFTTTM